MALFSGCGSRSSDFDERSLDEAANPLPGCPDSPNCVRITIPVNDSPAAAYDRAFRALQEMKPYEMRADPDEYRLEAVFVVVLYSDDMTIQLSPGDPDSASVHMHIRSASRRGYTDFGVNRRRVRTFLTAFRL